MLNLFFVKALILTYGTRGDVEPFLALARRLKKAGLKVTLATSGRFRDFVESFEVDFSPLPDESLAAIESSDGKMMLEGRGGLLKRLAAGFRLAKRSGPINERLMKETWRVVEGAQPDFILFHSKIFGAPHAAERLGIPAFLGVLQPMVVPTRSSPVFGLPRIPLPGYNRFTYRLVRWSFALFQRAVNRFRKEELGLAPIQSGQEVLFPPGVGSIPVLHALSPTVCPRPHDWPESAFLTGCWRLEKDQDYSPSAELSAFLNDSTSPVFVGFGSMTSADPQRLGRLVVGALRRAGRRGVVARGWAELEVVPGNDILPVQSLPYDWLFPRMAAVVHHGGAGTTSEGFHAGVPSVICPFFGDQPGWARLSVELGVGAECVAGRRLTEERLAASIHQAVSDPRLLDNARRLAKQLCSEDGVTRALEIILKNV